jgi:hypothetical protein
MLPLLVNGEHKQGDVFEHEFDTADDELENLNSGLLELQPNTYKVIGESRVHETDPGEQFEAAIPWGQEDLLVAGGHIVRVESEPEPEPVKKKPSGKGAKADK